MTRPMRVVVCGTRFGQVYAAALTRAPERFRLVGILARGSARSAALAEEYGVPLYDAVEQLPDDVDAACVVVSTAVGGGRGAELAKELLERGIHVLQEHPVHPDELAECLRVARGSDPVPAEHLLPAPRTGPAVHLGRPRARPAAQAGVRRRPVRGAGLLRPARHARRDLRRAAALVDHRGRRARRPPAGRGGRPDRGCAADAAGGEPDAGGRRQHQPVPAPDHHRHRRGQPDAGQHPRSGDLEPGAEPAGEPGGAVLPGPAGLGTRVGGRFRPHRCPCGSRRDAHLGGRRPRRVGRRGADRPGRAARPRRGGRGPAARPAAPSRRRPRLEGADRGPGLSRGRRARVREAADRRRSLAGIPVPPGPQPSTVIFVRVRLESDERDRRCWSGRAVHADVGLRIRPRGGAEPVQAAASSCP
ncbi:Gfo/Idh/MocA family oxidoreductase [Streptomyces sp. MBT56]|nr:Gfo/Idh/MocA family oxidoreductase [Streptomyces sp. MBT56]MBK3601414.1 Gfo/Idh/MocA family oxidoreductase [Streptomyces sp. MBT54]MBK3614255.1 Gfo/Idh/MocA family oxidoreductase [Streptomyces sp. MBT98]